MCVCLLAGHRAQIGLTTGLSEVDQDVLETFCVRSYCAPCQGQGQVHISSLDS